MLQPACLIWGQYNGSQANLNEIASCVIPWNPQSKPLQHVSEESIVVQKLFTALQDLYNFLSKSTGRFAKLKDHMEKVQNSLVGKNSSVARWIWRTESIKAVGVSYDILITLLEELSNETRTVSNLLVQIKIVDFYISLVFM